MSPSGDGGLGRAVAAGAGWFGITRIVAQIVQFASGIVLARLLTPYDFGVVASVSVFTGFAVLLFEGGLSSALVHHQNPTDRDLSTVFWLNFLGGILLAGLVALSARLFAQFYEQPILNSLAPLVGLTFAFSIGVVHRALLIRRFRFKPVALVEASSTIVGLVCTLVLAAEGWGAYSLAVGPIIAQVIGSIALFCIIPWRPRHFISFAAARALFSYSVPLVGADTAEYWGRNADNLIIGRFLGPTSLGFYNRAYNLMSLPVTQISNSLGNALSPALARMQDDEVRAGRAYGKAVMMLIVLISPIMVGLTCSAPNLVPLLWGEQWIPTIGLLQILSIAAIPQCLTVTTTWIYQAEHRTRTLLIMTVTFTIVGISFMMIGLYWGAPGVAVGVLCRYALGTPIEVWLATKNMKLPLTDLLSTFGRLLTVLFAMAAAMILVGHLLDAATPVQALLLQLLVGFSTLSVGMLCLLADQLRDMRMLLFGRSP